MNSKLNNGNSMDNAQHNESQSRPPVGEDEQNAEPVPYTEPIRGCGGAMFTTPIPIPGAIHQSKYGTEVETGAPMVSLAFHQSEMLRIGKETEIVVAGVLQENLQLATALLAATREQIEEGDAETKRALDEPRPMFAEILDRWYTFIHRNDPKTEGTE